MERVQPEHIGKNNPKKRCNKKRCKDFCSLCEGAEVNTSKKRSGRKNPGSPLERTKSEKELAFLLNEATKDNDLTSQRPYRQSKKRRNLYDLAVTYFE